jgi:glycosyltransferase involved in cell wall biosynthesis
LRYYPRTIKANHPIWDFLNQHTMLRPDQIRSCKIITEISRTDHTKRKDVLIKAFARLQAKHPDTLLLATIDKNLDPLGIELVNLIETLGIEKNTIVLGSVWDQLPDIYAITDIYCTPSVMEGFGMSPQEAAATRVPTVSSDLVPYVTEYLLGSEHQKIQLQDGQQHTLQKGHAAIVVPADEVAGFAFALDLLLKDDDLRVEMGKNAYQATIPYFTWESRVEVFLKDIDFE